LLVQGPACADPIERPKAAATTQVAASRLIARWRIRELLHDVFARELPGVWRCSRGRSIKVTEFEHRQITAVRKELDQEYEAQVGLKTQLSKDVAPVKNIQQSSDLTFRRCVYFS
jgi:hypothetical protein